MLRRVLKEARVHRKPPLHCLPTILHDTQRFVCLNRGSSHSALSDNNNWTMFTILECPHANVSSLEIQQQWNQLHVFRLLTIYGCFQLMNNYQSICQKTMKDADCAHKTRTIKTEAETFWDPLTSNDEVIIKMFSIRLRSVDQLQLITFQWTRRKRSECSVTAEDLCVSVCRMRRLLCWCVTSLGPGAGACAWAWPSCCRECWSEESTCTTTTLWTTAASTTVTGR